MNTILRSKMEREIGFGWEIKIESVYHSEDRRIVFKQSSSSIYYFCENADSGPAIAPMYSIVEVCPPGGEWLRVVDDPKVGSVWQCRRHHDDWYAVVRSVDEQWVTYDSLGREAVDQKCDVSKWHDRWGLVDSSRIVEGMDGGRRRRFVKTGEKRHARPGDYVWAPLNQAVRLVVAGKDGTPEAGTLHACAGGNTHTHGEFEILLPLNFIDPAPSTSSEHNETELDGGTKRLAEIIGDGKGWEVTSGRGLRHVDLVRLKQDGSVVYWSGRPDGVWLDVACPATEACMSNITSAADPTGVTYRVDGLRVFRTCKESLQVDHQSKKYIDDLLHRLGSVGEPGAYRDMVREAKAVIESLTMKVDPLSWDANPPMVGDIVAGNALDRPSLIGYVATGGKVSLCCSTVPGIPHDEFVATYRRLILSPLHKEAGR